jgi:hypothetical protein
VFPSDSSIFLFARASKTRDILVREPTFIIDHTDISEAGYLSIRLLYSSNRLENPRDNIAQDNYHISSSNVCREGALLRDNVLSPPPSQYEGNDPELVGWGGYPGGSLMVNGDQELQDPARINHPWVKTDEQYDKLSTLVDTAPVCEENVGAEVLKGIDWHHNPTDNIKAEAQSNHTVISPVKQESTHGKLAIRSLLKPKPQNLQSSFDGSPYASSTKETSKIYNKRPKDSRALGEARHGVSILSKRQHSGLLQAPSSPALSTEPVAPSMLSTPLDKFSRSWASDGNFPDQKPLFPDCPVTLTSLSNGEWQNALTQYGNEPNGSNSRQYESRPSKDASRTGKNGRPGKRKRFFEGGRNGEGVNDENDESDDGGDSTQRAPDKSSTEYTKRGSLACPFYKNDPAYFTADLFHDGRYLICATRGFPDIARLK